MVSEHESENAQKSKHISDLQLNFGALSARYIDLNNKLISEFSDKFKISINEPDEANASSIVPAPAPQDIPRQASATRFVHRFDN